MKIREVTHERVRQLKQFESARVTLTAILDDDDDVRDVLRTLKDEAKAFLYPKKEDDDHAEPTTHGVEHNDAAPFFGSEQPEDDIPY